MFLIYKSIIKNIWYIIEYSIFKNQSLQSCSKVKQIVVLMAWKWRGGFISSLYQFWVTIILSFKLNICWIFWSIQVRFPNTVYARLVFTSRYIYLVTIPIIGCFIWAHYIDFFFNIKYYKVEEKLTPTLEKLQRLESLWTSDLGHQIVYVPPKYKVI